MSTSTNAILCYGVDFDEEHPFAVDEDDDFDFEEWWYEQHGLGYDTAPENEGSKEYCEWVNARRENDRNRAVELVIHCSYDCPMYILAERATVTAAYRGYPKEINQYDMQNHRLGDELRDFCEKYGIELPDRPKWLLSSLWG